jgi:nucleoid-associated protein YgaU
VRTETPRRGGKVPGAAKYTIRPGDTLFEICEEFLGDGTRWREVAAMNPGRVGEDGKVFVNVTIDLPQGARTTPAPAPKTREATRGASGGTRSYVVKNGDTLSEVVMREVGSVRFLDRVRALNPWLKDQNDNIRVGQTLTLPGARRAPAR